MGAVREIWWVRHGPTHARGMVGWTDLPADLSDTNAIEHLAAYLPDNARVVSSDLSRAVATADAIARGRPRLPHVVGLREMHFGDWEMRTHAELEAEDPAHIRAFWETPGDIRPPGGESWNDMCTRVNQAVTELPAGRIVAVAHFGVILGQVQQAMRWSGERAFAQRIDNLSVTHIRYSDPWQAGAINHIP